MAYTPPVLSNLMPVRNQMGGPTVFRDAPSDTTIRWEGRDDPNGGDVQYVPEGFKQHPAFANMLRRGVLTAIGADEANQAMYAQDTHHSGEALAQQAADSIHRPQNNDMIGVPCIGPGSRQGASCTITVPMRQSALASVPPLCDGHKHLSAGYVLVEGVDAGTGLAKPQWVQALMNAPTTDRAYVGPAPIA